LFEGSNTLAKAGKLEVVLGRTQKRQLQSSLEDCFDEIEANLSRIDVTIQESPAPARLYRSAVEPAKSKWVDLIPSNLFDIRGSWNHCHLVSKQEQWSRLHSSMHAASPTSPMYS
jgi:hypothetical protein